MLNLAKETITEGLKAKTFSRCSNWVSRCRKIPSLIDPTTIESFSYKYHPWMVGMLDCKHPHCASQKGAQLAISEVALSIAFHKIIIEKKATLYGLPNQKPDASDFSVTRFDTAMDYSPYLKARFQKTKNIGLKIAGNVPLYIRGSRGSSQFKSIPVHCVILDEVDEMSPEAVAKAKERLSGQFTQNFWELSTPSIDGYGINATFEKSSQDFFAFKCPCCSRQTNLIFPDCLVVTAEYSTDPSIKNSHLICKECKKKLNHAEKHIFLANGRWQQTFTQRNIEGFHISQMYSSTVHPWQLATSYLDSLTNPADEQEFYNSKLGLPRIVAGAKISEVDIQNAITATRNGDLDLLKGSFVTAGIDVGKELHIVIARWKFPMDIRDVNMDAQAQIIWIGKIKSDKTGGFPDLDKILKTYKPHHTVIDALPERTSSIAFVRRYFGLATACYYNHNVSGKELSTLVENESITCNRTAWLDTSLGRFQTKGRILLPADTPQEFKDHLMNLVRKYKKTSNGETIVKYVNTGPDHFGHALNYAEIALKRAAEHGLASVNRVTT